jgi:hypothetical protein
MFNNDYFILSDDIMFRRHHPYIQSVYRIAEQVVQRFRFLPYRNDVIYALSPAGFRFRHQVNIAHKFTRDIIDSKMKHTVRMDRGNQSGLLNGRTLIVTSDFDPIINSI